jgi:phosphoenolpyruvate synthase/pyruvate phosphate dikinase
MNYKSTDYYLLFQTNGVNFFFTDLCTKYYDKFNGVTLSVNNQWRYYVHLSERALAEEAYKAFYKDVATVEESSRRFMETMDRATKSKDILKDMNTVSVESFDTFVSESAILMDEYSKFDHMYTDYLFKDLRGDLSDLVQLVQEKKNLFREYVNQVFFNEDGYLMLIIQKIADQKSVPVDQLLYASINKVRTLLANGIFKSEGKDGDDYALIRDNLQFTPLFGTEAKNFIRDFLVEENLSAVESIKGISVSKKGVYKGIVKKISIDYANLQQSVNALSQMERGIILVTESTVPEMLSIMARSLAVITDMGGMLSHAAITCRELDIPCIIGTKFATQVLKDGDMVEVDADSGIVKVTR